jgi:hypothetical protein
VPFDLFNPFGLLPEQTEAQKARGRNVEINNGRAACHPDAAFASPFVPSPAPLRSHPSGPLAPPPSLPPPASPSTPPTPLCRLPPSLRRAAMLGIFGFISASKGLIVPGLDAIEGVGRYDGVYMGAFSASDSG